MDRKILTYLGDPFERLACELDSIQTEETNGSLGGDTNHEEFVV